jgi:hypothetical protein
MNKLITATLLLTVFCFAQCKKNKPDSNGLPSATQEGKNTLGFLLNGQPWKPQGNNGTANLSIDVDFGFNQGVFGIAAYRILSSNNREYFGIGIRDSLNFVTIPSLLTMKKYSIANSRFSTNTCDMSFYDTTVFRNGNLNITKLDKVNRIISGTFNAILFEPSCGDTIKITDGRFDMKF